MAQFGKSVITIGLNWDELHDLKFSTQSYFDSHQITKIGARLVYPEENGAFTQSVTRDIATTVGVITLEVPATKKAHLYLVAVDEKNGTALYFAERTDMVLVNDALISLTAGDLTWIEAEWLLDESSPTDFPCEQGDAYLNVLARDPFQVNQDLRYGASIIGVWGTAYHFGNQDGWYRFSVRAINPSPGTKNESVAYCQPYLRGYAFSLGDDFSIPPLRHPLVNWY